MAASYPGTIKTFSTKAPGEAIASSHINDLQNEVVAVETQLITSKLATLAAAPVGNQVLTSVAGTPTWATFVTQTFTPTLTSGSGTFTDASVNARYVQIGKLVFVKYFISITTNGTAEASAIVTLPVEQQSTFKEAFSGYAFVLASGSQRGALQIQSYPAGKLRIYKYDGTYPGEDGVGLAVSGIYEVA